MSPEVSCFIYPYPSQIKIVDPLGNTSICRFGGFNPLGSVIFCFVCEQRLYIERACLVL